MKKNTSIIFLSIFALAMSVFGFMGIQPVKATTTLGGVEVYETDIQFKGASLNWAEEKFDEEKGITTSGEGRLKFYSSYSTGLISALEGKEYKLGTLIARAEDFASYEEIIVGANGVINVETTDYIKTHNSGAEGEVDAWWSMVSINNIPRAYYGVELVARPYVEVDVDGNSETVNEYAYASYDESKNYAYSLATTAQMKLDAGHFNVENTTDLTVTGTKVQETYTKFKVTVYYDPLRLEEGEEGWDELPTREVDGTTYCYKEMVYNYGDTISNSQLYANTPFAGKGDTYYNFSKGFYDRTRTYWIDALDITLNSNIYKGKESTYDPYLTLVYGDMSLYEVVGPANLIDDFATVYSKRAAVKKVGTKASSTYNLYQFDYMQQDDFAEWYSSYEDENGVVEDGVLEVNSYFNTDRTSESNRYFMFKSSLRGGRYFYNASGISDYDPTSYDEETGTNPYYENGKESDYDYVSFRILIKTNETKSNTESVTLGAGAVGPVDNTNEETSARPRIGAFYDSFNGTDFAGEITVPTNQWITIRLTRMYYEKAIGNDRMSAINVKGNVSLNSFLYVNDGCRVDNKNNPAKEGEYTLLLDEISYDRDMRVAINGDDGVDMVELKNINTGSKASPKLIDRTFITRTRQLTSYAGEEITLSTVLKNGTIKYSVVAPNGDVTALEGNTFTPTQIGTYKVIATCDDYLLQGSNRPGISKSYQYGELEFEVLGRDVNFNLTGADDLTTVLKGSTLNIADVTVDGLEIASENITYFAKVGEGDYAQVGSEFIASETGDYSVIVKYNHNGAEFTSDPITFTVIDRQVNFILAGAADLTAVEKGLTLNINDVTVDGLGVVTDNLTYFIKAGEGEYEEFNGEFLAEEKGDYSVYVKFEYNGCEFLSDAVEFTVVAKQIQLDAKFYLVEGETQTEITEGQTIWMDSKIAIELLADGNVVTNGITYEVKRVDVNNSANDYEFTVTDATFIAGFVGDYEIVINYTYDGELYTFETALEVVANTLDNARYAETYSNSESVYSAWLLDKNNTNNASIPTANKKDYKQYYAPNEAEGIYGTKWHSEVTDINGETKYGVISTTPQLDYVNSNYGTGRLGIHLRSTEYTTTNAMVDAGFAKTIYNDDKVPTGTNVARYVSLNCENWDYISIPVYFPKADAQPGETIKVGGFYNTEQFDVPYNTWYELRLDKPRMIFSYLHSNGNMFNSLTGSTDDGKPLFHLAYDDASAQQHLNQVVYIDSISFQKYAEYERFTELYFYDNVNQKALTTDVINDVEYEGSTATASFSLKATIGDTEVDISKMKTRYITWSGTLTIQYVKDGKVTSTSGSGYGKTCYDGVDTYNITKWASGGYKVFCYTYHDDVTGKDYIGYRMLLFNAVQKT